MEEQTSVTYDDMVQTRNVQMLKSIIPFLDFPSQKPAAMLIQYLEMRNAYSAFSKKDNSMRHAHFQTELTGVMPCCLQFVSTARQRNRKPLTPF